MIASQRLAVVKLFESMSAHCLDSRPIRIEASQHVNAQIRPGNEAMLRMDHSLAEGELTIFTKLEN